MVADPVPAVLILVAIVSLNTAAAQEPGPPHGSGVVDAQHTPAAPTRGQPVHVALTVNASMNVTSVTLIYCRAEHYACAPSLGMTRRANGSFSATIPWHGSFFRGVENVGYNFTLKHSNGTSTSSPRDYWPYRPSVLPPDAGIYYFYQLDPESASVPVPTWLGLGAAAMAAATIRSIKRAA